MVTMEVDGVPVLLAATNGRTRAGLSFRVGQADETLATHGITHVIEHLALYRLGATALHFNGATADIVTHFVVEGNAAEIVAYIAGVCDALRDLPLERFDAEKAILATEAASIAAGPLRQMALWRHGARDFGVPSFPEFGLRRITPDDVAAWAATWFTRQNAVLWMAGDEIPPDLRIDLPEGARMPVPAPSNALPVTPAYFAGPGGVVGASMIVERGVPAVVFSRVLKRQLFQRLRHESGVSYVTETSYVQQSAELARVYALADATAANAEAASRGFVGVLADISRGTITEPDLADVVAALAARYRQPDADAMRLPLRVFDLLVGHESPSAERWEQDLRAVRVDTVAEVARRAHASTLLMAPSDQHMEWAGYERAPETSPFAVAGTAYRSRNDHARRLIVAPDGVSAVFGHRKATVLFQDCVGMLAFADGGRHVIGSDAVTVQVEPGLFALGGDVIARIDSAVDPAVVIPMPERAAGERPTVTAITRGRAYRDRFRRIVRALRIRYRTRRFRPRIRRARLAVLIGLLALVVVDLTLGGPVTGLLTISALVVWLRATLVSGHRRRR